MRSIEKFSENIAKIKHFFKEVIFFVNASEKFAVSSIHEVLQ